MPPSGRAPLDGNTITAPAIRVGTVASKTRYLNTDELIEDDALGNALAVAAKGMVDLAGGQQRGELVPEGVQDAGWDRGHETSA